MNLKNLIVKPVLFMMSAALAFSAVDAYAEEGTLSPQDSENAKIVAIYTAAKEENDTDGIPSTVVRYVLPDGTYKQYILHNDSIIFDGQGQDNHQEETDLGFVRIYPQKEETLYLAGSVEEQTDPGAVSGEDYVQEGVDTEIRIDGYTDYNGVHTPYFLKPGDKIAVVSPSSLPDWEQTSATVEGLRSWGYEPVLGRHVYDTVRTMEQCVEDFKWALEDPEIRAIFCVRGGYGATEVMDAFGLDLIKSAAKPIIGYSDITAYHGAWTLAGLPSIHACMSAAFNDFHEECVQAQQHMMAGELPIYSCAANSFCRAGTAEGILIGGNLSTFVASLGTAYDSTKLDQPYILFLEEVGENMQHIHRYLTVLKHSGILDKAAGIVFGEWTELPANGLGNYGEARGGLFKSVAEMITRQFLDDLDMPIAFGFPAGHGEINYPLLLGAAAKLEISDESYTLSWPGEDPQLVESEKGG